MSRSTPRRRVRAIGLGLLLALLAALGAEGALQVLGPAERDFRFQSAFPAKAGDSLLRADRERFFALRGHRRLAETHAGRYACEEWPFRGRRPPTPAGDGRDASLAVVLGDSCVFGIGVDADSTLTGALADRARAASSSTRFVNLGVPGYSLLQIETLLLETLERHDPATLVLYPGAWNDQAVAVGRSDVELARDARSWWRALRLPVALGSLVEAGESEKLRAEELARRFEAGEPGLPRRVPAAAYEAALARIAERCGTDGRTLLVVAPAHPAATAERFPATREYARITRAVATAQGLPLVDAQALFERSGLTDAELFVDFVHPSPPAFELLAEAIFEALQPRVDEPRPACEVGSGGRFELDRTTLSSLGDEPVTLRWTTPSDTPSAAPVVTALAFGEAVLLDLRREGVDAVRGTTMATSPGPKPVRRFHAGHWCDTGLEVLAVGPTLAVTRDAGVGARITARPGDQVLLQAAAPPAVVDWTPQGLLALDPARQLPDTFELVCDEHGRASLDLEPFRSPELGPLVLQAYVLPAGLEREPGLTTLTNPVTLTW